MNKKINYSIRTAKLSGKVYYSFDDIVCMLGIDSKTAVIHLDDLKIFSIFSLEGTTKATCCKYILYDGLVKLIAFGNNVNPADIKLFASDIPLENIEKTQLTAVISVEPPSEENGQMSSVTVLADKVYSTTDIAKEYRMDISTFHKYLECRNVLHREWKTHKYLLCDRFCGKGLVVNIPNVKYLRWTEKGKKLLEYMLKQDGYEKVVRKHG